MSGGEHYESKSDSLFHILVPVFDLKCHIFYISISIFSASTGSVCYDFNTFFIKFQHYLHFHILFDKIVYYFQLIISLILGFPEKIGSFCPRIRVVSPSIAEIPVRI